MSTDTYVFIGWYAVCTMSKVKRTSTRRTCSLSVDHQLYHDREKYCPVCGALICDQSITEDEFFSLGDVIYNGVDDLEVDLSKKDINWLEKKFGPPAYSQDWEPKKGTDIVYMNGKMIDADSDPVRPMKHETFLKNIAKPEQKDVDRLTKLMRYTKVELKFGILITNA